MNNNLKVILGTIAGAMVVGLTVVGANQAIQAMQNTEIKVSLNGQVQEFKDDTMIIDNTEYVSNYSGDDFSKDSQFTVEEYYNNSQNGMTKAIGAMADGENYLYKFDSNYIGSTADYGGLTNAIRFDNDRIIINLPTQGGL